MKYAKTKTKIRTVQDKIKTLKGQNWVKTKTRARPRNKTKPIGSESESRRVMIKTLKIWSWGQDWLSITTWHYSAQFHKYNHSVLTHISIYLFISVPTGIDINACLIVWDK